MIDLVRAREQAHNMLAARGRFPSGGDVPYNVALTLIADALAAQPVQLDREAVAELLWRTDYRRATGKERLVLGRRLVIGHTNSSAPTQTRSSRFPACRGAGGGRLRASNPESGSVGLMAAAWQRYGYLATVTLKPRTRCRQAG